MNEVFSAINEFQSQQWRDFAQKKDGVIRDAFASTGFVTGDPEEIRRRITVVSREGDPFEHYYLDFGTPQEKRVISFERLPEVKVEEDWKLVVEARYY